MIKLLQSNFYRLKKSMTFWILLIIMAYLGIFIYDNNNGLGSCDHNCIGNISFGFNAFIFIILPIFTSLFIGTEYSDGGIRNKIIKGHTRRDIYISNLLTSLIVSFIYSVTYIIFMNVMGLIWGNGIASSLDAFLILTLDSILLNIYITSLFTFISMTISNKTASSIISFATVIWSVIISTGLQQKIYHASGVTKSIYQFILNIIPMGQSETISSAMYIYQKGKILQMIDLTTVEKNLWIYSLVLIIIINICGIIIFNKKQLN